MTRRVLIGVLAVVAAGVAAVLIWFFTAGNVGDPTEVTAPPITSESPAATGTSAAAPASTEAPVTTAAPVTDAPSAGEETVTESGDEAPPAEPEAPSSDTDETGPTDEDDAAREEPVDSATVVELELSEGTEARFSIYEDLRGEPFTVVGVTTEVVGRVRVDLSDLSGSEMGDILINARTFVTDSSNRDRAIRGPILAAEQYEFITFRPTGIVGLSGAAEPGDVYSFTVTGDLIIRETSRPATFTVVARWTADQRLEGSASTTVLRSDFDLSVPSVPFVANVGDEIGLELDFTAAPAGLG